MFLALTGKRVESTDTYRIGLGTHYVPIDRINRLEQELGTAVAVILSFSYDQSLFRIKTFRKSCGSSLPSSSRLMRFHFSSLLPISFLPRVLPCCPTLPQRNFRGETVMRVFFIVLRTKLLLLPRSNTVKYPSFSFSFSFLFQLFTSLSCQISFFFIVAYF